MSIAKKILSIILSIALVMGISAMSVYAVQPEPAAGVQATASQWWGGLPDWVQSILRWLFFGWIWMRPVTPPIQPLDNAVVAATVINAIETDDIAALEALMCKNIKQNVSDLPGEIGNLLDAIDGAIVESSWRSYGGYQGSRSGKSLSQTYIDITFSTSTEDYLLLITLETSNNFAPEELGIRRITLTTKADPTILVRIAATEGVMVWHD